MDIEQKKTLAMTGDMSKAACAHRLQAAIAATGLSNTVIAKQINKQPSSITNQVNGDQFPSRDIMAYLYEYHRIDFNFIMAGAYNHLPVDVTEKLFPQLAASMQS